MQARLLRDAGAVARYVFRGIDLYAGHVAAIGFGLEVRKIIAFTHEVRRG
ncbi:MAG: hypothetical protein HYU73_25560 [Betaproteobacteria bacterium]|nr:hypothetical protein [Betaproteobacteria bacterium]